MLGLSTAALAATCPATVAGLPPSSLHAATDPRLVGPALVVVFKEARSAGVYAGGALAGCWDVALAVGAPAGPKAVQGDRKTPEGWYRTSDKPWSQFDHAIAVHYPNARDAAAGLAAGRISRAQHDAILAALAADARPPQDTRLGGEILLHGGGSEVDWTLGCVALDDSDILEMRKLLPAGMRTDVLILP